MKIKTKPLIEQGWSYDRTDRNGTKYYFTYKCERCGGTGYINYFSHIDKGVCFKCEGSGTQETKRVEKIMTPDEAYRKDYNGVYNQNLIVDEASAKIKEATAALNRAKSASQHIGTVGDKVEMNLRLGKISGFDGMYGYTFIYRFYDEENNVIIWKTSKAPADFADELQEGNVIFISGTIKAHSEYKGEPQTILTRCKIK